MQIQLWSYNFAPENVGIGPISTVWAKAMAARGHTVDVVTAHPHYPTAAWGLRSRPYRQRFDGISVLRLPLWMGRESSMARLRQEATFAAAQLVASPLLPRADVIVSVSPSFPALGPAVATVRARRIPWVLWLQDLLPDAAVNTGLLHEGWALAAARRLERLAYRTADRIVLISERHREMLRDKGVGADKLRVISNPSTLEATPRRIVSDHFTAPRVLSMGNMGLSHGLPELARAFEASEEMARRNATLHFVGHGVQADAVKAEIRSQRTRVLGFVPDVGDELARATVGLLGQRPDAGEFNFPSRLMNFMGHGVPVIAVVSPASEVARVLGESGAGWVVDADRPEEFPHLLAEILDDPDDVKRRGRMAREYAQRHFTPASVAARFEEVIEEATRSRAG
jgi:colanic acid biosynthesis glycosyl transferase WcaI